MLSKYFGVFKTHIEGLTTICNFLMTSPHVLFHSESFYKRTYNTTGKDWYTYFVVVVAMLLATLISPVGKSCQTILEIENHS